MYRKPIGPTVHGVIDDAFATLNTLASTLFGLKGPDRAVCYSFAATQGTLNALTDTPVGVKKVVPLRMHGNLETPYVPAILPVPWLPGAFTQRNARLYFGAFFATEVADYLLTDYNDYEPEESPPGGQEVAGTVVAEFA